MLGCGGHVGSFDRAGDWEWGFGDELKSQRAMAAAILVPPSPLLQGIAINTAGHKTEQSLLSMGIAICTASYEPHQTLSRLAIAVCTAACEPHQTSHYEPF